MRSYEDVLKALTDYLNGKNIRYAVVGGAAVNVWGRPRTTRDVDLIFLLEKEGVADFVSFLNSKGFTASEKDIDAAEREHGHFSVFDSESDYIIDAKIAYGAYDIDSIATRRLVKVGEMDLFVSSPESLILNKLRFGSEQDFADAISVYARQEKSIDAAYLDRKAKDYGLQVELRRLKEKAGRNT